MKFFLYIMLLSFWCLTSCQPQEKQVQNEEVTDGIERDTIKMINKKWEGTWEREGSIDPSSLNISNVTLTSFDFYIASHDGMKEGNFSGKATLEDNLALYMAIGSKDTCQINFILQDSLVVINQSEAVCSETSGLNFSGDYYNDRYFKEKVMEEDAEQRAQRDTIKR